MCECKFFILLRACQYRSWTIPKKHAHGVVGFIYNYLTKKNGIFVKLTYNLKSNTKLTSLFF